MRNKNSTLRTMAYLLFVLSASAVLAACGGGGGGTGPASPGPSGPAALSVSVASAPNYPAGTTFATTPLSPATADPANSPAFDNVFVWVTKIALIPSEGPESPDGNGELEQEDSSAEEHGSGMPGFVTITLDSPVRIDLLHPPTGGQVASFLNMFSEVPVPAGEYSKIRVYYDNVIGHSSTGDTTFHATAHYHFDIHFVEENLVIPVAAPQVGNLPQEGIRFYSVVIKVVGLKYHQAGGSGNVLLRPQVFAEFVPPVLYSVAGTARNVIKTDPVSGSFNVEIGGMAPVPVVFNDGTSWAYSDNVLFGSTWRILDVPHAQAADAFRATAQVKVIGWFDLGTFHGTAIMFTFPDVRRGTADNVWILDNTAFIVRGAADNVLVIPQPGRSGAFYDNLAAPGTMYAADQTLHYTNIDNTSHVRARGYFNGLNLESYWISIAP